MFTKSNQINNFGCATRFQTTILEDSFCSIFYILIKCTETNCRVCNSVQNSQAPFFFHSSQTAGGKHYAEMSSLIDDCDEGRINDGTSLMCVDVVGEERAESRVCDLFLLYGEQYTSETDGGSRRIGMFSTGEDRRNMIWIGRVDFPEAERFRAHLSFWSESQIDFPLFPWLTVGVRWHISVMLFPGDGRVETSVGCSKIAEWEDLDRDEVEVEEFCLIAALRLWGSTGSGSEQGGGRIKVGTGEIVEGSGNKWDILGGLTGAHEYCGVDKVGELGISGVFCWSSTNMNGTR